MRSIFENADMGDVGFRYCCQETLSCMSLEVDARIKADILEPSGSFLPKQLSMIRLFSSSNFSARLIVEPAVLEAPLTAVGGARAPGPGADADGGPRGRGPE